MSYLQELRKNFENSWPEVIAREEIAHYTGGLYQPSTLEAYDAQGIGVKNSVRVSGRKIGYPKKDLIDWIMQRLEMVNAKSEQ
nr:MAG TPA: excisionase [Herelleviridae sp.]